MKLSVALCTFNGERFLPEQLASIAAQIRLPDELVVSDDGSQDGTAALVERFAQTADFPVRLRQHRRTVGVSSNFSSAIAACRGDVIVLADQDDVWLPEKLARLVAALADSHVSGVFSDATVVDEQLQPLGYRLWQSVGFAGQAAAFQGETAVDMLLKQDIVTGATLAFRADCRDLLLPIPSSWMHDAWIGLLLTLTGRLLPLDEPLIHYRQHRGQLIGGRRQTWIDQMRQAGQGRVGIYQQRWQRMQQLHQRLVEKDVVLPAATWQKLSARETHFGRRAALGPHRWQRLVPVGAEVLNGRYRRFSAGWKSAVKDLLHGVQ